MSEKLLPCPFCGGKADFSETNAWWVRCNECNAETEADMSPEAAAEIWNKRTPPPSSHVAGDTRIAELETEIKRLKSERLYIVGCNDGFEEAISQAAAAAYHACAETQHVTLGEKARSAILALATTEGSTDA